MAAVAKLAVIEYHVFAGRPQLGCIPASLADNPYAHSSLFKENKGEINILPFGLHALLYSLFVCFCVAHGKYEVTQSFM